MASAQAWDAMQRFSEPKGKSTDIFQWNCHSTEIFLGPEIAGMPTSPDSVCLDKSRMVANEPLVLDQGFLMFDPEMFGGLEKQAVSDLEMFQILETFSSSDDDETQTDSAADPSGSPESSTETTETVNFSLRNKRIKSFASTSSDDSEIKPKKIKASPKHPRSRMPTSAYRGVSRCTKDGRWQARIRIAKEVVYLGRFPTEEQAAKRYDEAARLHHGTAAMLNFVTPEDIRNGRKSVFSEKSAAQ